MPFPQRHPAKFTTSSVLGAVRLVLTDHCKHLEYDKDKEKVNQVSEYRVEGRLGRRSRLMTSLVVVGNPRSRPCRALATTTARSLSRPDAPAINHPHHGPCARSPHRQEQCGLRVHLRSSKCCSSSIPETATIIIILKLRPGLPPSPRVYCSKLLLPAAVVRSSLRWTACWLFPGNAGSVQSAGVCTFILSTAAILRSAAATSDAYAVSAAAGAVSRIQSGVLSEADATRSIRSITREFISLNWRHNASTSTSGDSRPEH